MMSHFPYIKSIGFGVGLEEVEDRQWDAWSNF